MTNNLVVTINRHITRSFKTARGAKAFVGRAQRGALGVVFESLAIQVGPPIPADAWR